MIVLYFTFFLFPEFQFHRSLEISNLNQLGQSYYYDAKQRASSFADIEKQVEWNEGLLVFLTYSHNYDIFQNRMELNQVHQRGPPQSFPELVAPNRAPEGVVYRRTDATGEIAPYGGQAKSETRYFQRQGEHGRAHPDADFEFEIVGRAEPGQALDVLEHNTIQEMTGGVAAKKSSLVSNKKDPVGGARRKRLGLPEPRRNQ